MYFLNVLFKSRCNPAVSRWLICLPFALQIFATSKVLLDCLKWTVRAEAIVQNAKQILCFRVLSSSRWINLTNDTTQDRMANAFARWIESSLDLGECQKSFPTPWNASYILANGFLSAIGDVSQDFRWIRKGPKSADFEKKPWAIANGLEHGGFGWVPEIVSNSLKRILSACKWICKCVRGC